MILSAAYHLGSCVESLKIAEFVLPVVKTRKKMSEMPLLDTFRSISDLLAFLDIEDTPVDKTVCWIKKLESEYKSDQKLKMKDSDELFNDAKTLDELLYGILLDRPVIELSHKGALNPKELLKTSEGQHSALFEKQIWTRLPEIARSDFSDSAKCLLTEASTPATMVGLRGIEAVIKEYYIAKTRKPEKKMLGDMIKVLRDLPNSNEKLLGYLDYLRSEKRNLAQHPNKTFTQKEAERIFMEIVSAVHDIYSEMDCLKKLPEE